MRRIAAILAFICTAYLAVPAYAVDDSLSPEANAAFLKANSLKKGVISRADGLQFKIIQNGFGNRPGPEDTVKVYYTGTLINGTVFDGTSPGLPETLKVDSVVAGWVEALLLMREGDHWQLVIPADLGYGNRTMGDGVIPPDQTLVFDIRLIATKPPPKKGDKDYVPTKEDQEDEKAQ